jgi:hypothetical protein
MSEIYTKAPGRGRAFMSYRTLWFGEHEMLQVSSAPGREDYEHLYYRDIQALHVKPRRRWRWLLIVCAIVIAAMAAVAGIAFKKGNLPEYAVIAAFVVLPFVVVLVKELIQGPSCECFAVTAVQRYQLHAWDRVRLAKRGVAMLRERVMRVQS